MMTDKYRVTEWLGGGEPIVTICCAKVDWVELVTKARERDELQGQIDRLQIDRTLASDLAVEIAKQLAAREAEIATLITKIRQAYRPDNEKISFLPKSKYKPIDDVIDLLSHYRDQYWSIVAIIANYPELQKDEEELETVVSRIVYNLADRSAKLAALTSQNKKMYDAIRKAVLDAGLTEDGEACTLSLETMTLLEGVELDIRYVSGKDSTSETPINCALCNVKIGRVDINGYIATSDNYNVCEQCGAEVCGKHCLEKEEDYWVCHECASGKESGNNAKS